MIRDCSKERVIGQYAVLEAAQLRARFQAKFRSHQPVTVTIKAQRVGAAAKPVQGEHGQASQTLTERMGHGIAHIPVAPHPNGTSGTPALTRKAAQAALPG